MKVFVLLISVALSVPWSGVQAGGSLRYVAIGGLDAGSCTSAANPCATLGYALDLSGPNDTIFMGPGEYTQSALLIDTFITIQGAGRDQTFLQAHPNCDMGTNRVIQIAPFELTVTLKDLTIRHGVATGSGASGRGGGIYHPDQNGQLVLNNVALDCNRARVGGGLLSIHGGTVQLEDVLIINNQATQRGAGIYNAANTSFHAHNVQISNNIAEISGGGIYNESGVLVQLDQVNFNNNMANQIACGALCLQGHVPDTWVTDSSFFGNHAGESGGALFLGGSSARIENVLFANNFALGSSPDPNGGGAVYIDGGSSAQFKNVQFTGNQTTRNGGAILQRDSNLTTFDKVRFENNVAQACGGAVRAVDSTISFVNAQFYGNSAVACGGGAMSMSDSGGLLANVTFRNNQAIHPEASTGYGGALQLHGSTPAIRNAHFSGNQASADGGAISLSLNGAPAIWNASFSGNIAGRFGGAIAQSATPTLVVHNSVFWGNAAGTTGHQIYNNDLRTSELHYSLHRSNVGDIYAGAGFTCNQCSNADPKFQNAAVGDLWPLEGSPLIDNGNPATPIHMFPTNENLAPIDIMGNPRFTGPIDIGAYEWWPERIFSDRFEQ